MRIAILSTLYPFRGGISQFGGALFKQFQEMEHDVKGFTFSRQYPKLLFPGKTQYVENENPNEAIETVALLDTINPFSYAQTSKAIRSFAPDLVIINYFHPFFAPSLGYVAQRLKKHVRVVGILHNVIPHEKHLIDNLLTKYFLKHCHHFIVMSESVQKDLQTLVPKASFSFKQHPLYTHFGNKQPKELARKQLNISLDKKTLLFFGFIRAYKGLDLLIEAFDQLDDSFQLLIAGESYTDFSSFQASIDANRNNERIKVLNRYIQDEEVALLFSASDVCVLPYKSATQSGITAISYHFDLPIIATDVGGLKESILHGKTGCIIPKPEVSLLKKAIEDFFRNKEQVDYSEHTSELKRTLSWQSFCEKLLED